MSTTSTDWPYDADRTDPLTALRIPVVGSAWPRWNYIVSFDSGALDEEQWRPNDREAAQIRSFLDQYIEHWYNAMWQRKLKERPFDIDGGANGITFRKWGPDDWGYRHRTWEYGPTYVPSHPRTRDRVRKALGPLTLVEVMDRTHAHGGDKLNPDWLAWKAAHPEEFGG